MEYVIVLGICVLTIFVLKFAFQVRLKDLKKIKEIGYDEGLNEITNKLPDNKTVCEEVLKQVENTAVTIKTSDDEENTLSYYLVVTNNIIIADIKNTFTRIQTIAHECMHSIQNRKMLLFNFIFSNIYLLYFAIILVLTIFKVIVDPMIFLIVLIILGFIYYAVRGYLETDAMTKAPYVAKEYMERSGKLSKDEIETIMENYKALNQMGIPITNFSLILNTIIKVIIYCIVAIII